MSRDVIALYRRGDTSRKISNITGIKKPDVERIIRGYTRKRDRIRGVVFSVAIALGAVGIVSVWGYRQHQYANSCSAVDIPGDTPSQEINYLQRSLHSSGGKLANYISNPTVKRIVSTSTDQEPSFLEQKLDEFEGMFYESPGVDTLQDAVNFVAQNPEVLNETELSTRSTALVYSAGRANINSIHNNSFLVWLDENWNSLYSDLSDTQNEKGGFIYPTTEGAYKIAYIESGEKTHRDSLITEVLNNDCSNFPQLVAELDQGSRYETALAQQVRLFVWHSSLIDNSNNYLFSIHLEGVEHNRQNLANQLKHSINGTYKLDLDQSIAQEGEDAFRQRIGTWHSHPTWAQSPEPSGADIRATVVGDQEYVFSPTKTGLNVYRIFLGDWELVREYPLENMASK